MDGTRHGKKPPLEVKREFTTSRLEVQVMMQTYELIVPMIRRPISKARTLWDLIDEQSDESPSTRMAQGA